MFFIITILVGCSDYNLVTHSGTSYDVDDVSAWEDAGQAEHDTADEAESTVDQGTASGTSPDECVSTGDELCDGIDNDCDGYVDEGDALDAQTWFYDADGDGHGGPNSIIACAPPYGYAETNDDCDDTNIKTYPGAMEWCDFEDNDCDGLMESVDPDAVDFISYADFDDDTYGGGGAHCSIYGDIPEGHTADKTDCVDDDAAINPAAPEIANGIDDNCDGIVE